MALEYDVIFQAIGRELGKPSTIQRYQGFNKTHTIADTCAGKFEVPGQTEKHRVPGGVMLGHLLNLTWHCSPLRASGWPH